MFRFFLLAVLLVVLGSAAVLRGQAEAPPKSAGKDLVAKSEAAVVVARVVRATEALWALLDEKERGAVRFAFDDKDQRRRWSNLPTGIFARRGLRMGDLAPRPRAAVEAILKATLSARGYRQVQDNIAGDEVLHLRGDPKGIVFGRDEFYFSILGTPSNTEPWMWQFGGHHLAINATIVGEDITLAPSLTGGQPTNFRRGEAKVSLLQPERDAALAFLEALDVDSRKAAIRDARFADLAFGPGVESFKARASGLLLDRLDAKARRLFLKLVRTRVGILNEVHADRAMRRIEAKLSKTSFAWFGPTTAEAPFSFRIQGPVLVMEYAPQGRRRPGEHLHAMYRDPTNEYGAFFISQRLKRKFEKFLPPKDNRPGGR